MSIPFLSVRPQAIKLKVAPQFPAAVVGGVGVSVKMANGVFSIDLDIAKIQEAIPAGNSYVIVWDGVTGQFSRIRINDLATLMGL